MKTLYVTDITSGTIVQGETFAIVEVKAATDKNDRPYYDLTLGDRTGQVRAKIWSDNLPNVDKETLKVGKVGAIWARVEDFRGKPQLNIMELRKVDETQLEEYLESSVFPVEEMWQELMTIIGEVKNHHIRTLLENLINDVEMARRFKYWPAAVSYHHDFRSGLLQHILECLSLARGLDKFYPEVDFDIVNAGIILHDIGKLEEIDAQGLVARYTVKGSVLGHLYLGTQIIDKYAPQDMPEKIQMHLKHIVLSHHGLKEKGSPVLPATAEALLVSGIDEASAKVQMGFKGVKDTPDEIGMTSYNRWLERWMWADSKVTDVSEAPTLL